MSTINGLEILENSPLFFWIISVVAVLAVSISKSGFGGAMGSFSVPIMLFVLPPKLALGVLLPIFLVTDIWVVYIWRNLLEKRTLIVMCFFGLMGQIIGWLIFDYLNDHILGGLIGLIAIITALNYAWRRFNKSGTNTLEIAKKVTKNLLKRGLIWCGLSGISSFVSLSGGIPAQIFLLPHALPRQAFIGTLCVYFFVINLFKIPFYYDVGVFSGETLDLSIKLLIVIPIGVFLGKWLNNNISDKIFYDISHVGLFVVGISLFSDLFYLIN